MHPVAEIIGRQLHQRLQKVFWGGGGGGGWGGVLAEWCTRGRFHCTSYLEMNCILKIRLSKLRDDCIKDCGRFFGRGMTASRIWLNDVMSQRTIAEVI